MMPSGPVDHCVEAIADSTSTTETATMGFAALNAHGMYLRVVRTETTEFLSRQTC